MSRRLTELDKIMLSEYPVDDEVAGLARKHIDPDDTSEFHEGMAAGLLLAIQVINKSNGLNAVSAQAINALIQESLKYTI